MSGQNAVVGYQAGMGTRRPAAVSDPGPWRVSFSPVTRPPILPCTKIPTAIRVVGHCKYVVFCIASSRVRRAHIRWRLDDSGLRARANGFFKVEISALPQF
jgi:hypothetical protein